MSAIAAMRGTCFWIRVGQLAVPLVVLAAGVFVLWYRATYNVWPGQVLTA